MSANNWNDIQKITDLSLLDIDVDKEWSKFAANAGIKKEPKIFSLSGLLMKVAAAVIVVLGVSFTVYKLTSKPFNQTFAALGTTVEAVVENATQISLNKNSEAVCSADDGVFSVNLKGQAYFDVEKNPQREFRVKTSDVTVIVHGTSFDVCEKENMTVVTVTSGNVEVRNNQGEVKENLTRGKQLVCLKNGEMKVSEVENFNSIAWKLKKFEFTNTPMKQVVSQLSKAYDFKYCFESCELEEIPLTGEFDNQCLNSVLRVLEQTLDIKIEKTGEYYKIKK